MPLSDLSRLALVDTRIHLSCRSSTAPMAALPDRHTGPSNTRAGHAPALRNSLSSTPYHHLIQYVSYIFTTGE